VTETLKAYPTVAAAEAAGYQTAPQARGPIRHYVNLDLARDADILDPAHPEGLVFYTVEGHDPVLLGAFFTAPRGVEAPRPAGDLVVWHSHDPSCTGFFATAEAPCTDTRRMLHVWTADTLTVYGRRGRSAQVRITDPFGAPFQASVERVTARSTGSGGGAGGTTGTTVTG
jgi:hypothetical protein